MASLPCLFALAGSYSGAALLGACRGKGGRHREAGGTKPQARAPVSEQISPDIRRAREWTECTSHFHAICWGVSARIVLGVCGSAGIGLAWGSARAGLGK